MIRRLVSRRTLKWTGTIACVLLAVVFVASNWVWARSGLLVSPHVISVHVNSGVLRVLDVDENDCRKACANLGMAITETYATGYGRLAAPGIDFWPLPVGSPAYRVRWYVRIPLWIPFILVAIPTALLWRIDRRRPRPGCCRKCDYNLTGNTSGVCPECGTEVYQRSVKRTQL